MRSRSLLLVAAALVIAGTSIASAEAPAAGPAGLLGVDYYNTDCIGGPNLLKDAASPDLEREQMFAMHASGLNSLRYTINFTSDRSLINGGHGGAIPIGADGALEEPYRSRLVQYLSDAREAGFTDVTIAFYPYGPNSPSPWTTGSFVDSWNPSLYAANWRFMQDVHDLTKQYGPAQTHFDLMAEGPPSDSDYQSWRVDTYITQLYSDYVARYGAADAFFTVIDKVPSWDDSRLVHLVEDLKSTGKPLPAWWGLDIEYTGSQAAQNLADADATLGAYGIPGSFALGETAYESVGVAGAVKSFNSSTSHPVVQVEEYPNWGEPGCWSAPYAGDAYLSTLGIEPGPLRAEVTPSGSATLKTSDGIPVLALKQGSYTVVVRDASRTSGFRLRYFDGPARQTPARFRGSRTWTVNFYAGSWTYSAVGRKTHLARITVLR